MISLVSISLAVGALAVAVTHTDQPRPAAQPSVELTDRIASLERDVLQLRNTPPADARFADRVAALEAQVKLAATRESIKEKEKKSSRFTGSPPS
jgi:hypothetical protein